jgi:DNA-binding transcriptional MerR regulator
MNHEEPIAPRTYYSIGEVCDLAGLKPHVLRYWESQFEHLSPTKNAAGNRVYRQAEVELVLLVKHLLYEEKFTMDGARQRIRELREEGELREEREEVLTPELLQVMRAELLELRKLLTIPPEGLIPQAVEVPFPPVEPEPEPEPEPAPEPVSVQSSDPAPPAPFGVDSETLGLFDPLPESAPPAASPPPTEPDPPPVVDEDGPYPQLRLGMEDL